MEVTLVTVGATLSKVQLNWEAAILPLDAPSVNLSAATSMVQAPGPVGVKIAV